MIDWRYCEPEKGRFYWDSLERVVAKLNLEKIGITACLYEPPDWALLDDSRFRVKPEDFERFGEAIATRFKDRIAAYEIYNERPTGSWPQVAFRRADIYVTIQKAAYRGIKRGDAKALVLMTGLWEFPMYYLEDMYKAGAKGYFDAVNIHYYLRMSRDPTYKDPFRGDLDLVLKQVDYITRKYGDDKIPIWFTEYGWPATAESQAFPVGEEKMAEYMEYFLQHCMDSGLVEKTFWYVYYMPDGMALWHERTNRKRPAFFVYQRFNERLPTWRDLPIKPLPYPPPATSAASVVDAGFENRSSWTPESGATISFAEKSPHEGQRCLRMTCESPDAKVVGRAFPLEPGRAYELMGYIRMKGGLERKNYAHGMIHIELLGEGGSPLNLVGPRKGEEKDARSTNYYISDTDGEWYQVHYYIFTTAETRAGRIALSMGHRDAPRGEADFDDVHVVPVDLGAYDQ